MRYRVEMDVSFATLDDCLKFVDRIKVKKDTIMEGIEPKGLTLTMPKYLRWSECRHDEDPPAPCGPYNIVDWNT